MPKNNKKAITSDKFIKFIRSQNENAKWISVFAFLRGCVKSSNKNSAEIWEQVKDLAANENITITQDTHSTLSMWLNMYPLADSKSKKLTRQIFSLIAQVCEVKKNIAENEWNSVFGGAVEEEEEEEQEEEPTQESMFLASKSLIEKLVDERIKKILSNNTGSKQ